MLNCTERFIRVYLCKCILIFEGILDPDGRINNKKSILRLAQVAVAYAKAGERKFLIHAVTVAIVQLYYLRLSCSGSIRYDGQ